MLIWPTVADKTSLETWRGKCGTAWMRETEASFGCVSVQRAPSRKGGSPKTELIALEAQRPAVAEETKLGCLWAAMTALRLEATVIRMIRSMMGPANWRERGGRVGTHSLECLGVDCLYVVLQLLGVDARAAMCNRCWYRCELTFIGRMMGKRSTTH